MAKDVVSYMKNCHPNYDGSFKVYTRRAKKSYPITSMEVSAELGGRILDEFPDASVDVHEPDLTLSVEIRDKIYVYSQTIKGAGGMPIGTNGKAMLLLSGGIDSPVAGYMIAKRGVKIDAVYFHAPPYTSERAKTESCRPGKTGSKIQWTDSPPCGKLHRYPALYLSTSVRTMS